MSRRSSISIALAALVLAAPAAQARPVDPPLNTFSERELQAINSRGIGEPRPVAVSAAPVAPAADPGFEWADAAVGGGTVAGLALLAAGAVSLAGRRLMRA